MGWGDMFKGKTESAQPLIDPELTRKRENFERVIAYVKDNPAKFKPLGRYTLYALGSEVLEWNTFSPDKGIYLWVDSFTDPKVCALGAINPEGLVYGEKLVDPKIALRMNNEALQGVRSFHEQKRAREARQLFAQKIEGLQSSLPERVTAAEEPDTLRTRILAMPDAEPPVTDSLTALQFGDALAQTVNNASAQFLAATVGAHDRFRKADTDLRALTDGFTQATRTLTDMTGKNGAPDSPLAIVHRQIVALRESVAAAHTAALQTYRDAAGSRDLFAACETAIATLREKGAQQLAAARRQDRDFADDLEASLQSLVVAGISATRFTATAGLAAQAERDTVHALRGLRNALPLVESQLVAAAAVEKQGATQAMNGASLALAGAALEQTADLRRSLAERFTGTAQHLEAVRAQLNTARGKIIEEALTPAAP